MAEQHNKILYLPFDEPAGSAVAYDYSKSRADGAVLNAAFVAGKNGNAIRFDGSGTCEVSQNVMSGRMNSDFTLTVWVKTIGVDAGSPTKLIWTFNYEGVEDFWSQEIPVETDQWHFLSIARHGDTFSIYKDQILVATVNHSGAIKGFSLDQDYYSTEYGLAVVDDLIIFDEALSPDEQGDETTTIRPVTYYLDGIDIKDYGVFVAKSKGLTSRPKMKTTFKQSWDSYHGAIVDLAHKYVEERTIVLDCFIKTTQGKGGFVRMMNDFIAAFDKKGTHRLMVDLHPTHPLVFEVYLENAIDPDKVWNDDIMVGTFQLTLKEPSPVKTVLKHIRSSVDTKTASITITTDKRVTIFWGDGSSVEDVSGNGLTITHDYDTDGEYYIVIAGVIEEVASIETNAIIVWPKI